MTDKLDDKKLQAAVDLLRRTGIREFQIRWCEEEEPTIWMAVVKHFVGPDGVPVPKGGKVVWETCSAMDPLTATLRLCSQVIDGGLCVHCKRPAGMEEDPLFDPIREASSALICWYVYDPELNTFRRSCEGVADKPESA